MLGLRNRLVLTMLSKSLLVMTEEMCVNKSEWVEEF